MKKKETAFVFARGGSKGVKDKNIRNVAGKPLISHTIVTALQSSFIGRVVVSTDSEAIAAVAREYGADVLVRPQHLATDESPETLSWRHAIETRNDLWIDAPESLFISLPATSPMRAPEDIENAIMRFRKNDCDIVFGISPSHRNPYLNMVAIGSDDLIHIAMPGSQAVRRQDVPDMFDITTCVYVTSPQYVRTCSRLIDGRVGYVNIPAERSLDIDNEFDLYLADLMLSHPYQKNS